MSRPSQHSRRPDRDEQARRTYVIVGSRYHEVHVAKMARAAEDELHEIEPGCVVERVYSPGSFEIPVMVQAVLERGGVAAVLALGVIVRGQTGHADLIARAVTDALTRLALEYKTPVIHEVLLVENEEQARARSAPGMNNRGVEAARAAVWAARELAVVRGGGAGGKGAGEGGN